MALHFTLGQQAVETHGLIHQFTKIHKISYCFFSRGACYASLIRTSTILVLLPQANGAAAPLAIDPDIAAERLATSLSRLNAEQRAAATADVSVPLMILAGAGTGKTTTLIARIQHMVLGERIPPGNVLAITFTNKAAQARGGANKHKHIETARSCRCMPYSTMRNDSSLQCTFLQ